MVESNLSTWSRLLNSVSSWVLNVSEFWDLTIILVLKVVSLVQSQTTPSAWKGGFERQHCCLFYQLIFLVWYLQSGEGLCDPIIKVFSEGQQYLPQYWPLGCTTDGLCAADSNPLNPAVQPVFNPVYPV